jgi:hypothetical protein
VGAEPAVQAELLREIGVLVPDEDQVADDGLGGACRSGVGSGAVGSAAARPGLLVEPPLDVRDRVPRECLSPS